ncbi:hypothetical protein [Paenibacillus dakarensis]|uniref:hypothetical protein n=1 Tax=Paenibacillus dakarensis TaxID=1527293 RepID=UPI0006D56E50|nr:hypothetical protein [Paenibacillus dakarensis]
MKYSVRTWFFWVPVMGTFLIFVFLSAIHSISNTEERNSTAVYNPFTSGNLSDDNLVDRLRALPLGLKIGTADWNNGALYLDLKVTENPLRVEAVKKDLAAVLSFSFEDVDNVNRLFLRFEAVDPWSGSRYLILAANVRKNEWDHTLLEELKQTKNEPFSERLVEGLHLTLTNLWKMQFNISPAG